MEVRNNKRAITRGFWFYFFSFGWYLREAVVAFSRALSLTSKIITRKTYVKELLQISDVIIYVPYTQQKKKLETLTDKVTHRIQQHEHNVQIHSVTF